MAEMHAVDSLAFGSALAGMASKGRHGRASGPAGVIVREIVDFAAVSIIARNGRSDAVCEVLSRLLTARVTDAPRRTAAGGLSITGTGPGQWLAIARDGQSRERLASLHGDLTGSAAVVDQSDGRLVLEVSGRDARRALAKGVAIDLDPAGFPAGSAAQTIVALINMQIALFEDAQTLEIVTATSTAGSFWHWLVSSAAEFGLDVV